MKTRIVNMKRSNGLKRYFTLRRGGYRTIWTGEGKIAMVAPQTTSTKEN